MAEFNPVPDSPSVQGHAPPWRRHPSAEEQYLTILGNLLAELHLGNLRQNRTGVPTAELAGATIRSRLRDEFPVLTTKRVFFKKVVSELLWFMRGDTNTGYLHEHGSHIWDEWADEDGELGPVYGAQWRRFGAAFMAGLDRQGGADFTGVDQLALAIARLRENPACRRIIVTAWNPLELDLMALAPCHVLFQFLVTPDGRLNTIVYQRSADWFLGVPFNIASYALLTEIVAGEVGMQTGDLVMNFGSVHLYENHQEPAQTQIVRSMKRPVPRLVFNGTFVPSWEHLVPEAFSLADYDPHPYIRAEVAK